eukprot:jgi/Chlat1/9258/Chrsp99S08530
MRPATHMQADAESTERQNVRLVTQPAATQQMNPEDLDFIDSSDDKMDDRSQAISKDLNTCKYGLTAGPMPTGGYFCPICAQTRSPYVDGEDASSHYAIWQHSHGMWQSTKETYSSRVAHGGLALHIAENILSCANDVTSVRKVCGHGCLGSALKASSGVPAASSHQLNLNKFTYGEQLDNLRLEIQELLASLNRQASNAARFHESVKFVEQQLDSVLWERSAACNQQANNAVQSNEVPRLSESAGACNKQANNAVQANEDTCVALPLTCPEHIIAVEEIAEVNAPPSSFEAPQGLPTSHHLEWSIESCLQLGCHQPFQATLLLESAVSHEERQHLLDNPTEVRKILSQAFGQGFVSYCACSAVVQRIRLGELSEAEEQQLLGPKGLHAYPEEEWDVTTCNETVFITAKTRGYDATFTKGTSMFGKVLLPASTASITNAAGFKVVAVIQLIATLTYVALVEVWPYCSFDRRDCHRRRTKYRPVLGTRWPMLYFARRNLAWRVSVVLVTIGIVLVALLLWMHRHSKL